MITLNKFEATIRAFATNHEQLKSCYFDSLPDIGTENTVHYPSLFFYPIKGGTEESTRILRFKFSVADKVKGNKRTNKDILSDTEQIILDLLAYLKMNPFSEFCKIDFEQDYEPLIEWCDDNCDGWTIEIKFTTIFEWNYCAIPN